MAQSTGPATVAVNDVELFESKSSESHASRDHV